jgi:glycosyltransferase involved in cell wall biosynthesis
VRRQILCIHDLNTRICPQSYSRSFRAYHRLVVPLLARSVLSVATVSHASADSIAEHRLRDRSAILVLPNGHEHVRRWHPRHSEDTRRAATTRTIVMIASNAPHKNTALILGLAERIAAEGMRIAIVGGGDARVFREQDDGSRGVLRLGRISDDEMAALLKDSLCLAFPSLAEGFGLPPLEAMALGCPVVVSDRTSLPEICAGAALYASPHAGDDWMAHFCNLRDDPNLRADLVDKGRAQARRYSWNTSARGYLRAMRDIDRA